MNNSNNKVKYIPTLDGLRAIAILAVLIGHLVESKYGEHVLSGLGNYGVSLFFGISGYIISTYLINEMENTDTIDFKTFYLKRLFRLMPILWIYLLTVLCLGELGFIKNDYMGLFSSLTFWRNYSSGEVSTGQLWSLSVEEHFYFLLPSLLIILKKPKKTILSLLAICILIALWRKLGTIQAFLDYCSYAKYSSTNTFGRLDYMMYGVIAAYLQNHFKSLYIKFTPVPLIPILIIIGTYLLVIPFEPVIRATFFSIIILSTVKYHNGYIGKFLELKYLRYIGKISYSLYLWQQLLMYKMRAAPEILQSITGEFWSIPIAILLASLSYKYIENPARKYGYSKVINT